MQIDAVDHRSEYDCDDGNSNDSRYEMTTCAYLRNTRQDLVNRLNCDRKYEVHDGFVLTDAGMDEYGHFSYGNRGDSSVE